MVHARQCGLALHAVHVAASLPNDIESTHDASQPLPRGAVQPTASSGASTRAIFCAASPRPRVSAQHVSVALRVSVAFTRNGSQLRVYTSPPPASIQNVSQYTHPPSTAGDAVA